MNFSFKVFSIVVVLFGTQVARANDAAMIVVSSGYNSCSYTPEAMDVMPQFRQMLQYLQAQGKKVHYVLACHQKGEAVLMKASGAPGDVLRGTHLDFAQFVLEELFRLPPGTPLHFIGHSWGAWLNMQVALAMPKATPIGGFVTIDAISKINCTVSEFLRAYMGASAGLGCRSAPTDVTTAQYQELRSRMSWWRNYFQEASELLRSSFIYQADENFKIEFAVPSIDFAQAHRDIDNDERVWNDFTRLFLDTVLNF